MSLNKNYRWVLVTNLFVRNEVKTPSHVPEYSFEEIEGKLRALYASNAMGYVHQKETKKIQIRDIQNIGDDYLCLLVSVGDKDIPDTSIENFNSGEIHTLEKEEDEGVVVTGHILIKKERDANNSHLMLIEKVPGLYMSKVASYLTHIFKENGDNTYSLGGEHLSYRPLFDVLGHQSSTIREAMTNNTLQDIEFVGHEVISNDFDEHNYIQEQTQQTTFVVKRGIETENVTSFFGGILNKYRTGNYDKMFVRVKTRNGQIKQTEVDTERGDILAQAFVCNEFVKGFDEPLESACENIRSDIAAKLQQTAARYDD